MLPTVTEELERKTIFALETLVQQRHDEMIGDMELMIGVKAIWNTVSGLVRNEIHEMLNVLLAGSPDPQRQVQIWFGKQKILIVAWDGWNSLLEIHSAIDRQLVRQLKHDRAAVTGDQGIGVKNFLAKIGEELTKNGYRRVW